MPLKERNTRRRVKLYALNSDRQWDDKGTGHVSSNYIERLRGVSLLVRAESDGTVLLESKILPETAYQKQQDTLIVWSEGDNFDLALSFQEKAGCDEIWEKICQVQGRDPTIEVTQEVVEESEDERYDEVVNPLPSVELPPCDLTHLEEIKEVTSTCLSSAMRKEKLFEALENEGYVRKLVNVFRECEDQQNMEALHHLYDITKNIMLLNKTALFETMFSDELILDVIGMLEYDPVFPESRKYRSFLKTQPNFKEVIEISNPELRSKIHQTYRVQYIHDVVLPTPAVFEDNVLSALTSFIYFNRVEIVTLIQEDEKFLPELMTQLSCHNTSDERRKELTLFLREYVNFAQNLQPQAKETFYKVLYSLNIFPALELALSADDAQTKNAALDILTYIVEYTPSMVREYTLQQVTTIDDQDQLLINVMIEQLKLDTDPQLGHAVQLISNLRTLVDPENMLTSTNKAEKTEFLSYFYKHSIHLLIAPLLANTVEEKPSRDDSQTAQLLAVILELLSFCVEHHTYHIKNTILNKDLLRRVLVLMKSQHKFLILSALRFMRKVIGLKDEFYFRYIIKGNLFKPVIDALIENKGRYNLLDSAILEMFEFIRIEDLRSLYVYIIEIYGKLLDSVDYVQTFNALKAKYNQAQDRSKERERINSLDGVPALLRSNRYRRDQRQLDEEEEMWFNEDDDLDESEVIVSTAGAAANNVSSLLLNKRLNNELDAIGKSIDKKTESCINAKNSVKMNQSFSVATTTNNNNGLNNGDDASDITANDVSNKCSTSTSTSTSTSAINIFKRGLVDYEGDSDDEEEEDDSANVKSPTSKRRRFP